MSNCPRIAQEPDINPTMISCHLSQIRKVKKLNKWLAHEFSENQIAVMKCALCCFCTANHFAMQLWCAMKSGSYMTAADNPDSGLTIMKRRSTSQSQSYIRRRLWSLVACSWCNPLQLSESRQDHYCREVLLMHWKLHKKTASTGQSKRTSL
jgi:hypothetical protein